MDYEKLRKMTPTERGRLYSNAQRILTSGGARTSDAKRVIELIEASDLPYYGGGLSADDPIYQRMFKIVHSEAGKSAALDAVAKGLPAVSGVDPLLKAEVGSEYGVRKLVTSNAGYIVAGLMRTLGYEEAGSGACPPNCVIRTGMKWRPKK